MHDQQSYICSLIKISIDFMYRIFVCSDVHNLNYMTDIFAAQLGYLHCM